VVLEAQGRVKYEPHCAFLVDDVGYAPRQQAQQTPGHAEGLAYLLVRVRKELERQVVLARELLVARRCVRADANHLGSCIGKDLVVVTEGAGLGRTPGGIVLGVEVEHDGLLSKEILQGYDLSVLVRSRHFWGLLVDLDHRYRHRRFKERARRRGRDETALVTEKTLLRSFEASISADAGLGSFDACESGSP